MCVSHANFGCVIFRNRHVLISASRSKTATLPFAMDTDIGTELFAGYENDFNLIVADISSKLQGLQDQDGEPRKAGLRAAERAVEEAEEIVILFR